MTRTDARRLVASLILASVVVSAFACTPPGQKWWATIRGGIRELSVRASQKNSLANRQGCESYRTSRLRNVSSIVSGLTPSGSSSERT